MAETSPPNLDGKFYAHPTAGATLINSDANAARARGENLVWDPAFGVYVSALPESGRWHDAVANSNILGREGDILGRNELNGLSPSESQDAINNAGRLPNIGDIDDMTEDEARRARQALISFGNRHQVRMYPGGTDNGMVSLDTQPSDAGNPDPYNGGAPHVWIQENDPTQGSEAHRADRVEVVTSPLTHTPEADDEPEEDVPTDEEETPIGPTPEEEARSRHEAELHRLEADLAHFNDRYVRLVARQNSEGEYGSQPRGNRLTRFLTRPFRGRTIRMDREVSEAVENARQDVEHARLLVQAQRARLGLMDGLSSNEIDMRIMLDDLAMQRQTDTRILEHEIQLGNDLRGLRRFFGTRIANWDMIQRDPHSSWFRRNSARAKKFLTVAGTTGAVTAPAGILLAFLAPPAAVAVAAGVGASVGGRVMGRGIGRWSNRSVALTERGQARARQHIEDTYDRMAGSHMRRMSGSTHDRGDATEHTRGNTAGRVIEGRRRIRQSGTAGAIGGSIGFLAGQAIGNAAFGPSDASAKIARPSTEQVNTPEALVDTRGVAHITPSDSFTSEFMELAGKGHIPKGIDAQTSHDFYTFLMEKGVDPNHILERLDGSIVEAYPITEGPYAGPLEFGISPSGNPEIAARLTERVATLADEFFSARAA